MQTKPCRAPKLTSHCLYIASYVLILLLAVSAQTVLPSTPQETLNEALTPLGIRFKKVGLLPVVRNFRFRARDKTYHTIVAQGKQLRIQVESIHPLVKGEAEKYRRSKYLIIKNLYETMVIPYSGALTTITQCPEDKKPVEVTAEILGKPVRVLVANASKRYVLGVWDEELIKQKAAFAVLYNDHRSRLYQIIIFQPVNGFKQKKVLDILQSIETTSQ